MASWLSAFFDEYEGKALQRSGKLTREQVEQFFDHSTILFNDLQFKKALSEGYHSGQNAQELINQAQAKIWEEKVQPAVQGDFGISYLAHVLNQFGNDAAFTSKFYQFVHLEEKTLDEAELPPEDFNAKYAKLEQLRQGMEAQLKQHEQQMQGMSEEERQQFVARMYQAMVNEGLSMSMEGGSCGMPMQVPTQAPDMAPGVEAMPNMREAGVPGGFMAGMSGAPAAMSEDQNMNFFKNMSAAQHKH